MFRFPENFFWGAATSAHQVEGGNRNDWTEWELKNADRLAREAESRYAHWLLSWKEIKAQAQDPKNYISGRATDHSHRFREDFDIAKRLGMNAHRFSIEWSRIEPAEGKFNQAEIEHYREVTRALRERGMEPFVTLWHWTNPLWIRDIGGWENPKTIEYFARYVERLAHEFQNLIRFWIPLNEPTVYAGLAYVAGIFPPQVKSLRRAKRVLSTLVRAAHRAYVTIHRVDPSAQVGNANYLIYQTPYRNYPWNRLAVALLDYFRNWRMLKALDTVQDFIGVNYYHHDAIAITLRAKSERRWRLFEVRNENRWVNEVGWEIYPEGLYHLLKRSATHGKPIYITENGLADSRDTDRSRFILEHLRWVAKAMSEGVDVRGYLHWSLLDNFEWQNGFWPRFGLLEVDYKTLERKIRPSAWEYKKIIETNAVALP